MTNQFRVAVLHDYEDLAASAAGYEKLKARAEVTILKEHLGTPEKLEQALHGVDAILLMRERTRFGDQEFSRVPSLKLISQTGRGIAHLDLPAATRRGIAVAVTPNDNDMSTTELSIGLILSLLRNIPQVDRRMRHEAWPAIAGQLLVEKTVGMLGFGRIGKEAARILKAFGTRVIATSRTLTDEKAREAGAERVSLETLLRESDIVTIHIPLNPQTRGMIGTRELSLMKPGALLVNTSRGPIVSEPALIEALRSGHLGGAGLDVFDIEPLPKDHPLRGFDNVILLSHRGYAAVEVLTERYELALTNILHFLDGKPVELLNPEVLNS